MEPLPTLSEKMISLTVIGSAGLTILGIGMVVLWRIGKISSSHAYRGRFVLAWMVVGFLLCGLIGSLIVNNNDLLFGEADIGLACTGLVGGWLIGFAHGTSALNSKGESENSSLVSCLQSEEFLRNVRLNFDNGVQPNPIVKISLSVPQTEGGT